jgi:hypothetical protein
LFDNLGRQANKEVLTKNTMLAVLFKSANAGKITSKAMLKTLTEKGFSELNIDCMNYFMLRFVGNSDLKLQRVAWTTFDKLCQKEDDLDELEKATIESIYSIGKFGKKMDGGNITSMCEAINSTKAFNNIPSMTNFEFIMREGVINTSQINKSKIFVDVLQDENAIAKIQSKIISAITAQTSLTTDATISGTILLIPSATIATSAVSLFISSPL